MQSEPARILVVSGDRSERDGLCWMLANRGYDVAMAASANEAETHLKGNGGLDLVVVDLTTLGHQGIALFAGARADKGAPSVVAVTTCDRINTAIEACHKDADTCLTKPYTSDQLALAIAHELARRSFLREIEELEKALSKARQEAARERALRDAILSCIPDGVIVTDRDRIVELSNAAVAHILPEPGSSRSTWRGSPIGNDDLGDALGEALGAQRPGSSVFSREINLSSGSFLVNAAPVHRTGGQVDGAVAVMRDITAFKKDRVGKALFIDHVSRTLKAPLGTCSGLLDSALALAEAGDSAACAAQLKRTVSEVESLKRIVSEVMDLTALESGAFSLKRSSVRIRDVAEKAIASRESAAADKGISILLDSDSDSDPGTEDGCVLADRDVLVTVLGHLLDNAIKYTPRGGHVKVTLRSNDVLASFRIADDGIGISTEDQHRIFDEFYRVDREETRQVSGRGIGLSLAKQLVDLHGGRISVESAPGEGSRFTVSLPSAATCD